MVECEDHANQTECVSSLVVCCDLLIKELGYTDEDARSAALVNIRFIAYATQMILNLLDSWTIGNDAVRRAIPQLLGLKDVTQNSVQLAGRALDKTTKLSLALLAQFQIENCLRNLARDIELPESNKGFYLLAKALTSRLSLPYDLDTLNTPALIRNSLHRNGFHDSQGRLDPPIQTISGMKYEFRDGEKVGCASVPHVAHALEASIDVLGRIFRTPEILALPDPVYEQYAWEIATSPAEKGEETKYSNC